MFNRRLFYEVAFIVFAASLTFRVFVWQSNKLAEQMAQHCADSIFFIQEETR